MTDDIPREQVETALRFLEWSHGDALHRPWSSEAHAYYHAIKILEDALDEKLSPPGELTRFQWEEELIQRSRIAREQGYVKATLFRERYGTEEREELGLLAKIHSFFK